MLENHTSIKTTLDSLFTLAGLVAVMNVMIQILTVITLVASTVWWGIRFMEWWELRKRNQMRQVRDEGDDHHD